MPDFFPYCRVNHESQIQEAVIASELLECFAESFYWVNFTAAVTTSSLY